MLTISASAAACSCMASGSGRRLFHQGRILLRHGIHLRHGLVDLADAQFCSRLAALISP
jgi:hypothetical protein